MAALLAGACGDGPQETATNDGPHHGHDASVVDGMGADGWLNDGAVLDARISMEGGSTDANAKDAWVACGEGGCPTGTACKYGLCVPELGVCAGNGDCPGDSYCDTDKTCVPYGVPPDKDHDPECRQEPVPAGIAPDIQCEWAKLPAGDPTAEYVNVYTTPVVADLNLDLDLNKLRPSIVATTFTDTAQGRTGIIRVFNGRTCIEQMRIGGPDDPQAADNRPGYGTQLAIADLDGDVGTASGHPEIIALHRVGLVNNDDPLTVIAFGIDTTAAVPKLARRWQGRVCGVNGGPDEPVEFGSNSANTGPGIWDLDDDGAPEVVVDQLVFDAKGCLLNPPVAWTEYLQHGVMSAVADVDLDGRPDLVRYDGVYGWDGTLKQWEPKPYYLQSAENSAAGHVAVVDLGVYSSLDGQPATNPLPEIVVVSAETTTYEPNSNGSIRAQSLTGEIVFGPFPLPRMDGDSGTAAFGGHGGPPTAADFDGDGYPEFATAGNAYYTVFDPDCVLPRTIPGKPNGKCERSADAIPANIVTDTSGILWARQSQDYSSSETGSSVFDFDGDGAAEVVYRDECYLRVYKGSTGEVVFSAPASSGTGQDFPVVADVDGDFATEIVVARAVNGGDCASPDPLFPSTGLWVKSGGIMVLRDPLDRWVPSRPIWNQHAYSVTHVLDDGRIPRSSEMLRNWEQPSLNNFRQNSPGSLTPIAIADLTVAIADLSALCSGAGGALDLSARVCNRGTNPVQDGAEVTFYQGSNKQEAGTGELLCSTTTPTFLEPGECLTVQCSATVDKESVVSVRVDPDGQIADCHPGNNQGASTTQLCPSVK